MPASKDVMGSDEMRPGRSGPDTGTNEGGEGAEFTLSPEERDQEDQVSEDDAAGWLAAHEGSDEPGA